MERKRKPVIIALNGSPNRNGNTATLMRWVADPIESRGIRVKWIDISDRDPSYCLGCHQCLKTGECVRKDATWVLVKELMRADGIIVGSPVYEGGPTAQLKTVMDRSALFALYADSFSKPRSVGVATSGVAPTRKVAREISEIFGRRIATITSKTAKLSGGYIPLSAKNNPGLKKRAKRVGLKLLDRIERPTTIEPAGLKYLWIGFLRRIFLKRLITNNPGQFEGIIRIWKEKGWIRR